MQFDHTLTGRLARSLPTGKFRTDVVAEVVGVVIGDTGRPELLLCYADGVMEFFNYKECVLEPRQATGGGSMTGKVS